MHACPVKSVFSPLPSGSLNKSMEHGPFAAELSRFSYQIWADPLMADGFLQRRNDQPTVHGFKAPLTPLIVRYISSRWSILYVFCSWNYCLPRSPMWLNHKMGTSQLTAVSIGRTMFESLGRCSFISRKTKSNVPCLISHPILTCGFKLRAVWRVTMQH